MWAQTVFKLVSKSEITFTNAIIWVEQDKMIVKPDKLHFFLI